MIQVRIIGIGSPSGDDRIGWDAVHALESSGLLAQFPVGAVDTCCCDHPGALLALFTGVDAAIVVDAMQGGGAAGTVRKLAPHELALECGLLSSHGISVAEAIALGATLGLLPATLAVYGLEAVATLPATDPGPQVCAAIPGLLGAIAGDLGGMLNTSKGRRSGPHDPVSAYAMHASAAGPDRRRLR